MSKKVFIVGGGRDYATLWRDFGYDVVTNIKVANVVQFTGGSDVTPQYYGEATHPKTGNNINRDEAEAEIFDAAEAVGIPMAGICRGGQFLNVMNGGKMYQHCDGHAVIGTHKAVIVDSGAVVDVSSTHHQIMRPNLDKGIILMKAKNKLCTRMEYMDGKAVVNDLFGEEVEAIFYEDTKSLCFQPHPEFYAGKKHSCVDAYRYMLRNYLELDVT